MIFSLLALFRMRIFSVSLFSKSRYVIVIVDFRLFIRFIVFSSGYYKVFFFHVNQSLSCIRSYLTDLVSIVYPVFF